MMCWGWRAPRLEAHGLCGIKAPGSGLQDRAWPHATDNPLILLDLQKTRCYVSKLGVQM